MSARVALTRPVSAAIAHCELTHVDRTPIDLARARDEHAAYERALERHGYAVRRLPLDDALPDAVFIEDTAIVLDEVAVVTRPGAESRRAETVAVREALAPLRPLVEVTSPGTIDGGDVLRLGRTLYVGVGARSNESGVAQLREALAPHGYAVRGVAFEGALHLKTAATAVREDTVLVNPAWVDAAQFDGAWRIEIDPTEPFAGNALLLHDGSVIHADAFPRTRERLTLAGIRVTSVPAGELARAEGGVTCCSLLLER